MANSIDTKVIDQIFDPKYLEKTLRKTTERMWFERRLQDSLRHNPVSRPRGNLPPRAPFRPSDLTPIPRAGEVADVLDALLKVPAVKQGIERVKAQATEKLKRDWQRLSSGQKIALITQTILLGGGAVAGTLASKSGRLELYQQLKDREIPLPVPGVPGLELQLKAGKENKAVLMFDIAKFLRER